MNAFLIQRFPHESEQLARVSLHLGSSSTLHALRRYNALMPLCRLPAEVVVRIIGHMQDHHTLDEDLRFLPRDRTWRTIMGACTRLRMIAISSPVVWSFIDHRWPRRWVELCLSRAGIHPLSVYIEVKDNNDYLLSRRILPAASTACIRIGDASDNLRAMVLRVPMPAMRSLDLGSYYHPTIDLSRDTLDICLQLRHMELHKVRFISVPDLSRLKSLRVLDVVTPSRSGLSFQVFEQMRSLENLRIEYDMEGSSENSHILFTDGNLGSTYAPAHLKSLHISANASIAYSLLSAMLLPHSLQFLTVDLDAPESRTSQSSAIIHLLERMTQLWSEVHNDVSLRMSPPHVRLALPLRPEPFSARTLYTVEYKSITRIFKMQGGADSFLDDWAAHSSRHSEGFEQRDGRIFRAYLCPLVNTVIAEQEMLPGDGRPGDGGLSLHLWAFSVLFPAWERLELEAPKPRAIIGKVQQWANTRRYLAYPPVIVSISPDRSFRRPDMVEWNPSECSLKDAKWTTSERILDIQ
jgi:hypothetical protein